MSEFNLIGWITDTFGISPLAKNSPPEAESIGFIKDASGKYAKWIGVYSNSFRDDDLVPEILTSDGHKEFVKEVDAGNYPLPELWLWHQPEWRLGEASFVAVDEVEPGVTFAIAGGDIDPGKEHVAKAMAKSGVDWRMSHTFYSNTRNDMDDSYGSFYVEEVSPLPASVEANPLTGFGLLEGAKMIDPKKREAVQELLGVDAKFMDDLETANIGVANMAKEEREFKAKTEEETTEEVTTEVETTEVEAKETEDVAETTEAVAETVTEDVAETTEEAGEVDGEVAEETEPVLEQVDSDAGAPEMTDVLGMLNHTLKATMTNMEAMNQLIANQATQLDTLQTELAEVKQMKSEEPEKEEEPEFKSRLTYASIMGTTAIDKETEVDEDDPLAKSGPEETEVPLHGNQLGTFVTNIMKQGTPN